MTDWMKEIRERCEKPTRVVKIDDAPYYCVTDEGVVYSISTNWRGYGVRKLVQDLNSHGYPRVRLTVNGKRRVFLVHKLVAAAFLPPRPSIKHEVRHLDGRKSNNRSSNLEWGTSKENAADRDKHGTTARGSRNGSSKLTEQQVIEIFHELKSGMSQRFIAKRFNITQAMVSAINRGKWWCHVKRG